MKKQNTPNEVVGGGFKKVLYTLQTVQKIGLAKSGKALKANNTCKACGLGMGGQQGGMTNELGEFPSVCNKSIQAQSTDIQPPIPEEIFKHPISELLELNAKEVERLGRLGTPLFKAKGASHFTPVDWGFALEHSAKAFKRTAPSRSFFYSSGRASNEAGFVLQLLARLYGTNNVNNCSYYCHQATGEGLATTIGTGTATVELDDLKGCDCFFLIGANPASNHPRLIHKLKQIRESGGKVIVINPAKEPGLVRFAVPKSPRSLIAGGTEIASHYLQPKIGSDALLLKGIAKAVIAQEATANDFITTHTEGFSAFADDIAATEWDTICTATGLARSDIETVASLYSGASNAIFAWGMGITHHLNGVENVESIANLALLRGMVGKAYAGLLPLRGHSNVQGIGTMGVKPVLAEAVMQKVETLVGQTLPKQVGMDTLACLKAAATNQIDAAMIMGGNLLEATPNTEWATQAMQAIGFKLFLTTTLNRGHLLAAGQGLDDELIILPVRARDEEQQATTQESMFNYVRLSDGGIERIAAARSEVAILVALAQQLLPPQVQASLDFSQFNEHNTVREAIAATIPGMDQLKDIGVAKQEFHVKRRILHTPQFNTPDQKAHFKVVNTQAKVEQPQDFPFTLATVRSEGQFNSIIYEEQDSYRGTPHRHVVFMNLNDIKRLGCKHGDKVSLRSATGEMKGVEVRQFNIAEGSMMAYYPEANVLTGLEHDARSKTPNFKSIPVQVIC